MAILIILGSIVFIHEAGHFLAALLVGIPVETFSIGFGPRLLGIRKGKTEYRLSLIPLGGYVLPEVRDEKDFYKIPVNKRILFSFGGPLSNIFFAMLILAILNLIGSGFTVENILINPVVQTADFLYRFFYSLPKLFSNPNNVSGITGIFIQGKSFIGSSLIKGLSFAVMLSLNLAVLNLLPIPVLDGGKILLYLLEKVSPKTVKVHVPLMIIGGILMLMLMIGLTVWDIRRFIL